MKEEMHQSIIKTGDHLQSKYSHNSELSCPLCPKFHTKSEKVIGRHLDNHIRAAVHFEETIICRCNLPCRHTGHYHCPFCANTVVKKGGVFFHVNVCKKKHEALLAENGPFPLFIFAPMCSQDALAQLHSVSACAIESVVNVDHSYTLPPSALPESPAVTPEPRHPPSASPPEASRSLTFSPEEAASTSEQSEMVEPLEEAGDLTEQSETAVPLKETTGGPEWFRSPAYYLKLKCPHCPLVLYKRNLSLHIKRKHPKPEDNKVTPPLERKSVQNKRCPFALPKGSGFCEPAGVQSKSQDNQPEEESESEKLSQFQTPALQNLSHGLCEHAASLEGFSSPANEGPLKRRVLEEMLKLGILKKSMVSVCKMRQKAAEEAQAPLSLLLEFRDLICLSVHEPKVCPFCCFGRVIVTYNRKEKSFCCPFTKASKSCGHKNIAKWHLFQTQKELFVTEVRSTEMLMETPQAGCSPAET